MREINIDNRSLPYKEIGIKKNKIVLFLFLIYFVGVHLRLSIYSGESLLIPMYLMLFSALLMALIYLPELIKRFFVIFSVFLVFIITQPFLSFAPLVDAGSLLASMQLSASIITCIAVIYALSNVDKSELRKMLFYIWSVLIVLAFIESVGLKEVFDEVRNSLYGDSGRFLYFAEARDIEMYGHVRPTVFASEPSFLADTLSAIILMIFFLDPHRGQKNSWYILGFMVAVSFTIAPSLKMFFYLSALLVWQFWPKTTRGVVFLVTGLITSSLLSLIFFFSVHELVVQSVGMHLESGSFYGRIVVGVTVIWKVLTSYPLYGYGIGNEEGLYPLILSSWIDSGAYYIFPWFQDLPATDLMTNGFWWMWSFLGIVGGFIFLLFFIIMLSKLGITSPIRTIVCVWIVWYAGFAFVDPLSWFVVVIFSIGAIENKNLTSSSCYKRS